MAVNLSARQFRQKNLAQRVEAILRDTGLAAHRLELEITESMVMEDPDEAKQILRQLHESGIGLAIDDFGTGHSSLSYLKRFPIDFLKIDRSFVRDIPGSADDVAIVRAIIALAKSMNLQVIAEGVETESQRAFLDMEGCEEAQGYLLGRPVDAGEIERQLREPYAH
jgi:EAL domain-containing protein (putative c-di-GMP-specific phosphodiesterase class I)